MDIKKMYTLSVPCITKFENDDSVVDVSTLPEKLWISSSCICRFSKDSLLIINGLYQAFYSTDFKKNYFSNGLYFNKKDLSPGTIFQLIKKRIIDVDSIGEKQAKVIWFNDCITAYYATLEVTQRCNARCKHCYNGYERTTCEPSLDVIKKRIDNLKQLGIQYIEVTGGEPLIRKDILEITKYILSNGLKYCIATNGSYVKNNLEVLRNAESVSISLDGDEEYHNKIRGISIYDDVISSLNILNKNSIRTLISMTVTNENAHLVTHVLDVARSVNSEVILASVVPTGKAKKNRLNCMIENLDNDGQKKIYGDSLARSKIEKNKSPYFYGCDMGRKGFTVSIEGKILPCLFMREFSIGDINSMTIDNYNHIIKLLCKARKKSVLYCEECNHENCGGVCIFSRTHINRRKKEFNDENDYCNDLWREYVDTKFIP